MKCSTDQHPPSLCSGHIPSWWPALLSAVDARDRALFARWPELVSFDRAPVPGELWPGRPTAALFVRVCRRGDDIEKRWIEPVKAAEGVAQ